MFIRQSLVCAAFLCLANTSTFAGSGNDPPTWVEPQQITPSVQGEKKIVKITQFPDARSAVAEDKTRAEIQKEFANYRKNPVTHDGFCNDMEGDGSSRYVGPQGQC